MCDGKQMELKIDMGYFLTGCRSGLEDSPHMDENKNDGHLLFLMGRCCEEARTMRKP